MKIKVVAAVLTALSTHVAAQTVVLPKTLAVGWLQSDDAYSQMSYCVPQITAEKVAEIQGRAKKTGTVFYVKDADKTPYLIAAGDAFACIDRNGKGKPILPPGIFGRFIRFEGASEETTVSLFRSLATQLATRGAADALVKFANGNALEVTLSVVEDAPFELMYTINFLKIGEYDEAKYRFVVADQIKSFSTTSYGDTERRALSILQNEITPRPLRGNYLQGRGTAATATYAFEGSTWRFPTGSSITLAGGGELVFRPDKGDTKAGSWLLENGTLYFNYGLVYGSAVLETDNKLYVEFRGLAPSEGKPERRWTATLEQQKRFLF